jgi:hypothetical protein
MSLLASCLQPNELDYYFGASSGGGGTSVSSISNGGNMVVSTDSGTGVATIATEGLFSVTAAATANGLAVSPTTGGVVVSYSPPITRIPPQLTTLLDPLNGLALTLTPGQAGQLFNFPADNGAGSVGFDIVQMVISIIGVPAQGERFPYAPPSGDALTGIPKLYLWLTNENSPVPQTPKVGEFILLQDDTGTLGYVVVPQMQFWTAKTQGAAGSATRWYLWASNISTGNAIFTINGQASSLWNGSALSSLLATP